MKLNISEEKFYFCIMMPCIIEDSKRNWKIPENLLFT